MPATATQSTRRIVSFLPSATEMACALGLEDQLFGVSHECDYPPAVKSKTVVVHSALPIATMTQRQIDDAVTARLRDGKSLYEIDEARVIEIAPDLILTQSLCEVCAPSGNEVSELLKSLPSKPEILWLTPRNLKEIFDNLRELAAATGRDREAEALIADGRDRVEKVSARAKTLSSRPRVFCMEWLDPVYCSGHWVPEMVKLAGGIDEIGREGTDSVRVSWEDVVRWAPEVLIVMPCGLDLEKAAGQAKAVFSYPGAMDLPAVRNSRVYAVDANSFFARPGPRVVAGTELLAHLIHPETFGWDGPKDAFRKILPT
jgi:iron complex transport system substrate-binding protein